MAKKKIGEIVEEISTDFLAENGLELYNVEFIKEGKDWFLRVYIDKAQQQPNGEIRDSEGDGLTAQYVSTQDCELVSRFLSEALDEMDPIEQNYYLEVSSPGMDRQLFTKAHYDRYAGSLVEVKLYKAVDGKKLYEGILVGLLDGTVVIKTEEDKTLEFSLEQVAKTSLAVVF